MRSRSEIIRSKAAAIAAGDPIPSDPPQDPTPETKSETVSSEPLVNPPKRRQRGEPPAGTADTRLSDEVESRARDQQARDNERRESADGKRAEDLTLGAGYDRIVTKLFQLEDPMVAYERVRASLSMGRASSASYGQLVDALDEAEETAMQAVELLINTKSAHDGFEIDAKIIAGALRDKAVRVLEDQKAAGALKKAITNDDVEAVIAANHPDEWQSLESRRGKARRTIDLLTALAEASRERAKDLRAMVSKFRGES